MKLQRQLCLFVPLGAVFFLAGCAGSFVPPVQISGGALNKYQYHGYSHLSVAEYAEGDYVDGAYFLSKAMNAAGGGEVLPTDLKDRTFSQDNRIKGVLAREVLIGMLDRKDAATYFPGPLAKAQVAYDCYLQELEEGHQPADIEACKAEFDRQIARLEALLQPRRVARLDTLLRPKRATATIAVEVTGKAVASAMAPEPSNIYFAFDRAELSPQMEQALDKIVAAAKESKVTKVRILGHTDLAGSVSYNRVLGLKRANVVARALQARGLDGVRISVRSEGESKPEVPTADGVPEKLNRRVVLIFGL